MVQVPERTKMVAADGRKRELDGSDTPKKVRIKALTSIRYPTGEYESDAKGNPVAVEKTYNPGDEFECDADDATAFCRPQTGALLHFGERQGSDAEKRHVVVRAERVRSVEKES